MEGPSVSRTVPPGLPVHGQRRSLHLAGVRGQVARGRDFTRQALADWRWLPGHGRSGSGSGTGAGTGSEAVDDVLLLVSELLANAALHGCGPRSLLLDATAERLRIEVTDGSPALPSPRLPHQPGRPSGHGLFIVQRLSDRWGATPDAEGKTVWVEIAASRLVPPVRPGRWLPDPDLQTGHKYM
ncbi:ATP-binding protein [Kitasatospora kazusensis]|uniref:ATP-binding protein n=1 Tax=Kitasatospora kazusensis TaxID=407974 RepID=A0ABP5KSH3_9ACTN